MNKITYWLMIVSVIVVAAAGGLSFYFTSQVYFADSVIYDTEENVALNGYDIVAYHKDRHAVKGTYLYQVTWRGVTWHFSELEYRNEFARTPEKFSPEFGGYDAYGLTKGRTYPTDQEIFIFYNGALYFFHSDKTKAEWKKNREKNLLIAEENWHNIRKKLEFFGEQNKK